ncbi:phage tail protein [Kineosporia succinea]|uniref:Phage tail-like protein n=1 Tax=Kineosporia succinea TaxID=84632 RepID=A0ABT9PBJ4_9ACTN|nr:phage tail protein [Kineosporia succinea]MDP9829891.1 phage tail-like protein [Kineosporia succinea]
MAETVIDSNTGLMSNAFYLEVDGTPMTMLTGIQGLDVSVEATDMQQTTDKGKMVWTRTLGSRKNSGTLTLNRLAVDNATSDGIWQWFTKIKDKGSLTDARKNGSVVLYASDHATELGRFTFTNAWVSSISTDSLDVSSGNPLKETIKLEIDSLVRTK